VEPKGHEVKRDIGYEVNGICKVTDRTRTVEGYGRVKSDEEI
jgi:hypothetical protein